MPIIHSRNTAASMRVVAPQHLADARASAYARIAHLLCEVVVRMRAVGLANGNDIELPVTQAELGDALGISTVHVNRTLQELRAAGLIRLQGARLTVLDWEGLKEVGEFDPTYLHLRQAA